MKKNYFMLMLAALFGAALFTACDEDTPPEVKTELELSKNEFKDLAAIGTDVTFDITSNSDWEITQIPGWCTVEPKKGTGNGTVKIKVESYEEFETKREATIKVTAKEIMREIFISQLPLDFVAELTVSPTEFPDISFEGADITFNIESNTGWTITGIPAWCGTEVTQGDGNAEITITVLANDDLESDRSATLTVSGSGLEANVSITQVKGKRIIPDPVFRAWLTNQGWINVIDEATGEVEITSEGLTATLLNNSWDKELTSIIGTGYFPALTSIYVGNCNISGIDVTKNLELKQLYCNNNPIRVLDVSKNTKLTELMCWVTEINELDVSNCPDLGRLQCDANPALKAIDVSKNPKLWRLDIHATDISTVDVSKNPELDMLSAYNTNITSFDVSKNPKLETFYCNDIDGLTSVDISKNPLLQRINISNTGIASIDVSKNPELVELFCSGSAVTSVDVSNNPKLQNLYIDNTDITSVDLTNNRNMAMLNCNNTKITSLDLSGLNRLIGLGWYSEDETVYDYLNISGCNSLSDLFILNNPGYSAVLSEGMLCLGALDTAGNKVYSRIKTVIADDIEANDYGDMLWTTVLVEGNPHLETLSLQNCKKLTAIELKNNPKLSKLYTGGSTVTVDQSGNAEDFAQITTPR